MKKTFLLSIIFIILGASIGILFREKYQEQILNVFSEGKIYYFLQEGIYSSKEIMTENTKDLDVKLINEENNKYYVYLGITRSEENAKKIKEIYKNKGYQLYIKEINLSNEEFFNNVTQFDLLIENSETEEEILTIEEVVLANYEEIIKKS
ncbi:MAG: hypothetical protein PUC82_00215 [bacterium]|nr:hypothetical protein [bacterium]